MTSSQALEPFTGFPPEGLQFLRDLAANNERPWFEAHRDTYLRAVQAPVLALEAALGEATLAAFDAMAPVEQWLERALAATLAGPRPPGAG